MVGKSRHQDWQCVQVIADYVDSSEYFLRCAEDNSGFDTYLFLLGNFGSGIIPKKSEDSSGFFRTLNRDLLGALLGAGTGTARAWNVGYPFTPFVNCVEKVAFSPNGKLLASTLSILRDDGSIKKWVKLWNITTGEELHTFNDDFFLVSVKMEKH